MKIFKKKHLFIYLVLLYFVLNFVVLFKSPYLQDIENVPFAESANKIINSNFESIFDLQLSSYQGGSLLESISAIPFILLFGSFDISVLFANLVFNLFILILLYSFIKKFFNQKISLIVTAFFVLSPSTFLIYSWNLNGHLYHSILFSLMTMYLFYDVMFCNRKNYKKYLLLGLVSGFSLWFDYAVSIMLFLSLIFLILFNRYFLKKGLKWYVPSFVLGFSPWIIYNIQNNFQGLLVLFRGVYSNSLFTTIKFFFNNLINLLFFKIPFSFNVNPLYNFSLISLNYVYCFIILLATIFLTLRLFVLIKKYTSLGNVNTKKTILKESFFIFYIVFYILIHSFFTYYMFTFSRFPPSFRFLIPMYLFFYIVLGIFIHHLIFVKRKSTLIRKIGIAFLFTILLFGFSSFLSAISFDHLNTKNSLFIIFDEPLLRDVYYFDSNNITLGIEECYKYEDIGYRMLCYSILEKKLTEEDDPKSFSDFCKGLNSNLKEGCYNILGIHIFRANNKFDMCLCDILIDTSKIENDWCKQGYFWSMEPKNLEYKDFYISKCALEYKAFCNLGIAELISFYHYSNKNYALNECRDLEFYNAYCEERLAWNIGFEYFRNKKQAIKDCSDFYSPYKEYCYFSIGFTIGDFYQFLVEDAKKECETLSYTDKDMRNLCFYGLASEVGWKFGYNVILAREKCDKFEYPYRRVCEESIKKYIHFITLSDFENIMAKENV